MGSRSGAHGCAQAAPRGVADTDAFKREFRAIAGISHPNLIRLHELVCYRDQWFFTMELVRGDDFHRHAHASPERLRAALAQLIDGLHVLHDAGVVHGDVKSANVLITDAPRVVLLDFGLTRRLTEDESDVSRSIRGTIAYLAPELTDGAAPTPASDWYSVGVMLYRALTGRYPFMGSPIEMLFAKQDRDPVPVRSLAPHAPRDLIAACAALLARDPWSRPNGPELHQMLGDRSAARVRSRGTQVPPPAFVGRPAELAALDDARSKCARGGTIAVFVHGVSGVGKTALLSRHAEGASAAGALVLSGRCYEHESIPYKGLDAAVAGLSRHLRRDSEAVTALDPEQIADLVRLFPVFGWMSPGTTELVKADATHHRRRAVGALRQLLAAVARRRPVVIMIDDVHWGDADGATLLVELLAPPVPGSVMVLIAFRGEEAERSEALRILGSAAGFVDRRDIELAPLSRSDSVILARRLLDDGGPEVIAQAEAIACESGGNPNFVGELARLIIQRRRRWVAEMPISLPTLNEAIAERIAELPSAARRLLRVISVAGEPFEPALASKVATVDSAHIDVIDLLLSSKLIRMRYQRERTTIEPYHDRIREVAAAGDQGDARAIHLALARTLETQPAADCERLAAHFLAARADSEAARYAALAAGRAAEAFAFDRAASLYAMALQASAPDAEGRSALEIAHAEALADAGRAYAAGRAFEAASRRPAGSSELMLRLRAADQVLRGGRLAEGMALFGDVLGRLAIPMPEAGPLGLARIALGRARLRLTQMRPTARAERPVVAADLARVDALQAASTRLGYVDPTRGIQLHNQHVLRALRAGEPYRVARALCNEAIAVSAVGGSAALERAERLLRQLDRLVDVPVPDGAAAPQPRLPVPVMRDTGWGLTTFNVGRWRPALVRIRSALDGAMRVRGAAWETMHLRVHLVWALYFLGELKAFTEEVDAGLAEASDRDDRFGLTTLRLTNGYRLLIEDAPETARVEASSALADWNQPGAELQHGWAAEMINQADLYEGRSAEAWEVMDVVVRRMRRSLIWQAQLLRLQMRYRRGSAAASAAAGASWRDRRAFLRAAAEDMAALRRERSGVAAAYASAIRAAIASCEAPRDAACLYDAAAGAFIAVDMAMMAAAARRHAMEVRGEPTREVDEILRRAGVVAPARFARQVVPR